MDFSLTEQQQSLRREIIRFAQSELNEQVCERDRDQSFSRDLWRKCAAVGLAGLPVPVEYGGSGLDPLSCAMVLDAFGYGCHDSGLAFSLAAHLCACVVPIWLHGTDEQKQRYLPGLCNGTLIGSHAMTEPDSGSDAFAMRTTAVPHETGFRLRGSKTFITNAPIADLMLVLARTDPTTGPLGGVTGFLLEPGLAGLRIGPAQRKMGLRTAPLSEVSLEDVYVPDSAVLGQVGGGATVFTTGMDWERIGLFAAHLGTMERLLQHSIQYARTRHQFGQPIGKFQAISHRIADLSALLEAVRLLLYRAAWQLGRSRRVSLDAAMAKLLVSETLVQVALATVQIHGGYGYMEGESERALRDAVGSTLYSGTSEMQRNIIARWLGL